MLSQKNETLELTPLFEQLLNLIKEGKTNREIANYFDVDLPRIRQLSNKLFKLIALHWIKTEKK